MNEDYLYTRTLRLSRKYKTKNKIIKSRRVSRFGNRNLAKTRLMKTHKTKRTVHGAIDTNLTDVEAHDKSPDSRQFLALLPDNIASAGPRSHLGANGPRAYSRGRCARIEAGSCLGSRFSFVFSLSRFSSRARRSTNRSGRANETIVSRHLDKFIKYSS